MNEKLKQGLYRYIGFFLNAIILYLIYFWYFKETWQLPSINYIHCVGISAIIELFDKGTITRSKKESNLWSELCILRPLETFLIVFLFHFFV